MDQRSEQFQIVSIQFNSLDVIANQETIVELMLWSNVCIVNISFNLDNWTEIYRNCGSITFFEYPKMFTSM